MFAGRKIIMAAVLVGAVLLGKLSLSETSQSVSPQGALPIAVLGDSDSHSYRDHLKGIERGGAYNDRTFSWLEGWHRLRPEEIEPGAFEESGSGRKLAMVQAFFGQSPRVPPKLDYAYNYALSGATCSTLQREWPEQGRWLQTRLQNEPERWNDGLIVIRIGVNDFGLPSHLAQWAEDPATGEAVVDGCLDDIAAMVTALRDASPAYIALVGVSHDYNLPLVDYDYGLKLDKDFSQQELDNVIAVIDRFDQGLARQADGDPRITFIQGGQWYPPHFGSRRDGIRPDAAIGGVRIVNAIGDSPDHLVTEDCHFGTIASGLFLQGAIRQLNEAFALGLTPITDEELVTLAGLAGS